MGRAVLFTILFVAGLPGCSSVGTTFAGDPGPRRHTVYTGVRLDAYLLSDCKYQLGEKCSLLVPYALFDFPFSVVADTLFLPYTIFK